MKIDALGAVEWKSAFGGISYEVAYSIKQTSDGGYIVAGLTASLGGDVTENFGYEDIWVLKLDTSGNLQWQKSFGDGEIQKAWEVQQTLDGGHIVTGYTYIGIIHSDYTVLKLDTNGDLEWQNNYQYGWEYCSFGARI
ncbi:hypothetical protein ESY86_15585 [Subsaximicrobium wynnwilliamsii]|uniref:Uncharacterized protein n=1 Tax=Subsaximicrobium wynnwilliamsii TaxID=291179 RepID=A0A5C6ZEX6_9FLAO|nr:hypothetical protein [Subsaximicrobium wynnwilliamsii]TXD82089.1 hypothetical protein ESY87_15175 [Subsaximicrobium wynnwilliamsii]TXD87734.1 hypothetical protein ESY86_15585 [Subsaximicrobium wynnwilliamsii]TXE01545.1 hypothetical protein ESY88_15165 [Subsaximicrobium wynnwilliamsii]